MKSMTVILSYGMFQIPDHWTIVRTNVIKARFQRASSDCPLREGGRLKQNSKGVKRKHAYES